MKTKVIFLENDDGDNSTYGKNPEKGDYFLKGMDPTIFDDEYYYELEAHGAKTSRGDDRVRFQPL